MMCVTCRLITSCCISLSCSVASIARITGGGRKRLSLPPEISFKLKDNPGGIDLHKKHKRLPEGVLNYKHKAGQSFIFFAPKHPAGNWNYGLLSKYFFCPHRTASGRKKSLYLPQVLKKFFDFF